MEKMASSESVKPVKLVERYRDIPEDSLKLSKSKVSDIYVPVGSNVFVFWFIVWTYAPVLTACVAPITNMMSIAALVSRWRSDTTGHPLQDEKVIYVLNGLSLALGTMANISLLLNFGRRVSYRLSQTMSIILFFLASVVLLSALLVSIDHHTQGQLRTEGFWFAVFTCILYAVCATTCLVNMIGVLLKKYPADLNLDKPERGLIVYTFILAVWFVWGAAMFSVLMDLSYGNAMYYCVVSLLTIGLGDIVPTTAVSKAMALVYSLSGVIILGLIIAMIRSMVTKAASPIVFWSSIEKRRNKLLKKIQREQIKLTQQQSFDLMRSIRHQAKRHKENMSSLYALLIFMLFWLVGAMVFYFAEDWTYFDAVYFSLLCLLTIGYGEPSPTTSAGRTFFILWALLAVPMMTALISSVGESLYELAMSGASSGLIRKLFRKGSQSQHDRIPLYQSFEEDEEFDDEDLPSVDQLLRNVQVRKTTVVKVKNILEILGQLIMESKNSPRTRYDYQEWNSIMEHLELTDQELKELGLNEDYFWLSNESPLSFPIREPDYLLFLLFNKLQVDVDSRTLELEQLMERLQSTTTASQVTTGEKSHIS